MLPYLSTRRFETLDGRELHTRVAVTQTGEIACSITGNRSLAQADLIKGHEYESIAHYVRDHDAAITLSDALREAANRLRDAAELL